MIFHDWSTNPLSCKLPPFVRGVGLTIIFGLVWVLLDEEDDDDDDDDDGHILEVTRNLYTVCVIVNIVIDIVPCFCYDHRYSCH